MRSTMLAIAAGLAAATFAGASWAAPSDDFAARLAGPWGRVDFNWQPYGGALSKNSCPAAGITRPSSVGLFGEGGTMWIEAREGGALAVHDGSGTPRMLSFVRMETAASAVYREAGIDRRFSLVSADRLSEERVPAAAGVPGTKYLRCKKKKP